MSFKPQSELTAAIFLQFTEKDRTMQFFSVFLHIRADNPFMLAVNKGGKV